MKRQLIIALSLLLLVGCKEEKSDKDLLEIDRQEMVKKLYNKKVTTYKFGKICIRASVNQDTLNREDELNRANIEKTFSKLQKLDSTDLSLTDYLSIYKAYNDLKEYIDTTDEDRFPTISEALNITYGDSIQKSTPFLYGNDKLRAQNIEHAALSALLLASREFGSDISLYECSKTKPELLPQNEIRGLLQFLRGFVFFDQELFYLSEYELTSNINWLEKNPNLEFTMAKSIFQWVEYDNAKVNIGFHALNYLFRGVDRLQMEREIDEKRAMEDFNVFLEDSKALGLDNELIWSVEAWVYLKNGEDEKAIAALTKLKESNFFSEKEKIRFQESVNYLQNRDSDKKLTNVYDKVFLSKITAKYMWSVVSSVDWKKILKENEIPHTEQIFKSIDNFTELNKVFHKYSSGGGVKKKKDELKQGMEKLLGK